MKKLREISHIGLVNTIRMNYRYFGWGGVLHLYILASRNLKIERLEGELHIANPSLGCIKLGFPGVDIFDYKYERSLWNNTGSILVEDKLNVYSGFRLLNSGTIKFGKGFGLSAKSTIICAKSITFGNNVLLSWDVLVIDTDVHKIYRKNTEGDVINPPADIVIGNNVWIGCRSLLLKGSIIPDNCVIAAGTTVAGKVGKENSIIADRGTILKENIYWRK